MNDVFITSTLHSDWNLKFNPKLCSALERCGLSCHLPQRDTNQAGIANEIFTQNIYGIKDVRKILAVAMNETPNWGGEVGFAYGINKVIIALTDQSHHIPLMLDAMVTHTFRVENLDDIERYIADLIKLIKQ